MAKYQRNNIIFRIASSAAIASFKTIQSYTFSQICRKDIKFDESAREIVLLQYDRFSSWITRIERLCLTLSSVDKAPAEALNSIVMSFLDEQKIIETVVLTHPEIFCPAITKFLVTIHQKAHLIFSNNLSKYTDCRIEDFYSQLVVLTSSYLQYILACCHEFSNNITSKQCPEFIAISDFSADESNEECLKAAVDRLKFFASNGCSSSYELKNYTTVHHQLSPSILEKLHACALHDGIHVREELVTKE